MCGEYYLFFFGEIEKCLKLDLFPSHSQARVGGFFPFKSFCKASPIVPGFSGDAIEAESEKLSKSVSFDFQFLNSKFPFHIFRSIQKSLKFVQ